MNDPFEAVPSFQRSADLELINLVKTVRKINGPYALTTGSTSKFSGVNRKAAKASFKKRLGTPIKMVGRLRQNVKTIVSDIKYKHSLICLSELNQSLLMWGHYAASHNGVVIGYEFDEAGVVSGSYLNPVKVRYREQRPVITETDLLRFGSKLQSIKSEDADNHVFEAVWLTKSLEWSYEKEWRVISHGSSGYQKVISLKPTEILVGSRVGDEIISKLEKICGSQLEIKRAKIDLIDFSMSFH